MRKDLKEARKCTIWTTGKERKGSMCQGPEAGDTVPGIIQEASEVETEQVIRVAGESI